VWTQSLVLGFLGIGIDLMVQVLYATAGGLLANALSRKPVKRWFERCIGGALMGLAAVAALVRRA
jgi:threonine/homoserine/homoserine lactone efflux protein